MYSSRKDDAYSSSSTKDEKQGTFLDHDYKGHCEEQISEPKDEELALHDQNVEEQVTSQAGDSALEVDENNPNVEQLTPRRDGDSGPRVTDERAYCCTCPIDPFGICVGLVAIFALASLIWYLVIGGK